MERGFDSKIKVSWYLRRPSTTNSITTWVRGQANCCSVACAQSVSGGVCSRDCQSTEKDLLNIPLVIFVTVVRSSWLTWLTVSDITLTIFNVSQALQNGFYLSLLWTQLILNLNWLYKPFVQFDIGRMESNNPSMEIDTFLKHIWKPWLVLCFLIIDRLLGTSVVAPNILSNSQYQNKIGVALITITFFELRYWQHKKQ